MVSPRVALALLAVAGLLGSRVVFAQSNSDLAIEMSYSGFDGLSITGFIVPPPTSTGGSITQTRSQRLTIDARNLGVVEAGDVVVEFFGGPSASPYLMATGFGCTLDRAAPPITGVRWLLGALPAGSIRRCVVELRSIDAVPGSGAYGGAIALRIIAATNNDPNSANDRAAVVIYGSRVDYIRDMALSIESPNQVLVPGGAYDVDFTFANLGPGDEGDPTNAQLAYSDGYLVGPESNEFFGLAGTGDPDCTLGAADIGSLRYSDIRFGPLPPGTSRTCTLRVTVRAGAVGTRVLGWYNWAEGSGIFDTNLANNRAQLVLQFPPAPVSTGSRWGWLMLALAIVLMGVLQKARTTRH